MRDLGLQNSSLNLSVLAVAWEQTCQNTRARVQPRAAERVLSALYCPQLPFSPRPLYRPILPLQPLPHTLPFRLGGRQNRVWLACAVATSSAFQDLNFLASIDMLEPDPANRRAALRSRFAPFWTEADRQEWDGLQARGYFERWLRKDLLHNDRVFSSRYVYKLKRDARTGHVSLFKARLILQGFLMEKHRDYEDTFAPTSGATASRVTISLATALDYELHSVDRTQAFIQADRLPEGV